MNIFDVIWLAIAIMVGIFLSALGRNLLGVAGAIMGFVFGIGMVIGFSMLLGSGLEGRAKR